MGSFRGWYHCTFHTYGAWLRGDPRGWRARHHREHVEGDYKRPPPKGEYDRMLASSTQSMKRAPVRLEPDERRIVCDAIVEKLARLAIPLAALSVSANHVHLLAQFPTLGAAKKRSPGMAIPGLDPRTLRKDSRNPIPRHVLGLIKKHASHTLRSARQSSRKGGLWATRAHEEPVRDERHFTNVFNYIKRHTNEGAVVHIPE